jgi:hypothetical protein
MCYYFNLLTVARNALLVNQAALSDILIDILNLCTLHLCKPFRNHTFLYFQDSSDDCSDGKILKN